MKVKNYQLLDQIGSGSYSTVYKARNVDTGEMFAIKKMREMPRNDTVVVQNQIDLLKRIKHKNIVGYIDDFKEREKWYIVFEYCGKGDLENFKNKQGRLPEIFCKNLMQTLIGVLSVLHQNKIVHRDLKLANILINDAYDFKLADFGFSKDNEQGYLISFCGTPYAMAPQILKMENYDERCDTWSLGIMLYQLLYGKLPFAPGKKYGAGIPGLANCVLFAEPNYDPAIEISEQCLNFMKLCLKKQKNDRPKASILTKHPWFDIGGQSHIRVNFLKNSFSEDKTELISRAQQIFNGAVQEHIKKLIKHYKLIDSEIKTHLAAYDKHYKDDKKHRTIIILMLAQIIRQLEEKGTILIAIEEKVFEIPLKQIKNFVTHFKNLRELLNAQLQKNNTNLSLDKLNIERSLIYFVAKQSDACLKLLQNFPQKNSLLLYISELPLNKYEPSQLTIEWSFNENVNKPSSLSRISFQKYIQELKEPQILKFINESYCDEDIHLNWLVEDSFKKQIKSGFVFQLGEFIHNVIKINMGTDKQKQGVI